MLNVRYALMVTRIYMYIICVDDYCDDGDDDDDGVVVVEENMVTLIYMYIVCVDDDCVMAMTTMTGWWWWKKSTVRLADQITTPHVPDWYRTRIDAMSDE